MDTVSVSLEVLGGILSKSTSELQAALMSDGKDGTKVLIDQSNIDKFVAENFRTRLADQKKAGEKEHSSFGKRTAFEEVEQYLVENHGIQKGTDWKSGISAVVTDAKSKAQTSDEVVKASEPYKTLEKKLQAADEALHNTKKEFRERSDSEDFSKTVESVLSDDTLGLAIPDDTVIRGTQVKSFNTMLKTEIKYGRNEKGELIPVDANGKQLEDANFNPLTLKSLVVNNAKTFWPAKNGQPQRQPPPAGQPPAGDPPPTPNKFPVWKNAEEFSQFTDKAMLEGKDAAYLTEATAAFESQPK